jgi:hypothetical protein
MMSDTAIVSAWGFAGILVTQLVALGIAIVNHSKLSRVESQTNGINDTLRAKVESQNQERIVTAAATTKERLETAASTEQEKKDALGKKASF